MRAASNRIVLEGVVIVMLQGDTRMVLGLEKKSRAKRSIVRLRVFEKSNRRARSVQ